MNTLQTVWVILDDNIGSFQGYSNGERWNGWECPFFTKETGLAIVDAWQRLNEVYYGELHGEFKAEYHPDDDCFRFWNDDFEEWDVFPGQNEIVEGISVRLYPIGAWYWTWSRVSDEKRTIKGITPICP